MSLPISSEWCLVHKSRDVVFPLKLDLSPLQLLSCEVRLHVSDLDVGMLRIQAGHIHLKTEKCPIKNQLQCLLDKATARRTENSLTHHADIHDD